MAMGIPPAETPNFDKVVRNHFPQLDETAYATRATEQFANSQQMSEGVRTLTQMAGTVDANMEGQTADASAAKSEERVAAFTAKGATFGNRAAATALAGQNILNTKTALNARAEAFEGEVGALKVQAVAEGWDQATYDDGFHALLDQAKSDADGIAANFTQTDTALKSQIKEGVEPTVPASMPSPTPGAGGGLSLPPELMQQMQGMLGQGMGMAQQLPQQLQGALGPLGEQGQQALDKVLQAVQGASGDVGVTPEMLDELLAGQDTSGGGGDSEPKGAEAEQKDDGFKGENSEDDKSKDEKSKGDDETAGKDDDKPAEPAAPSPAAAPMTAAPPTSAEVPTTTLSADAMLDELFA